MFSRDSCDPVDWSLPGSSVHGILQARRGKWVAISFSGESSYYFSSASLYKQIYEEYYADGANLEKGEKYVAPLYNYMLQKGMEVTISIIDLDKIHVLGTPEELEAFLKA